MADFNQAMLVGHLEASPSLRQRKGGHICTLLVVTTRKRKDHEGLDRDVRSVHTVVLFDRKALAAAQDFKSGDQVFVEGRLDYNKVPCSPGVHVWETSIIAERVILGSRCGTNLNR